MLGLIATATYSRKVRMKVKMLETSVRVLKIVGTREKIETKVKKIN